MSISLGQHRLIDFTAGFVADANPNATPPHEADIFHLRPQVGASPQLYTTGHLIQGEFNAEEAATFDFTTWVRNDATGKWMSLAPESGAKHRALFRNVGTMTADIFVQVTAVAVITAVKLTIRCGETAGAS